MTTKVLAAAAAGALCLLAAAAPVAGQQKLLTIDALYDPATNVLGGASDRSAFSVTWLNDTKYVAPKPVPGQHGQFTLVQVDALTGAEAAFFDPVALQRALLRVSGVIPDEAARLARQRTYRLNPSTTALLVTIGDDLYFWSIGADRATRLTRSPGIEEEATFSPDGRLVAYVRGNNLFVSDLEGGERALTTDGGSQLLNGVLDWVYEEEIYGRGTRRAFQWSPDSTRIAYLRLDEAPVHEFAVVDHIPYRQDVEQTDYPKAGDPNPLAALGVVRAAGGPTTWVDLGKYSAPDLLLVRFAWAPDSRHLAFQVQDREQTWLDLNKADATSGTATTLFRETTKAWVDVNDDPTWLEDGGFLWLSDRTGFKHLFHYTSEGTLVGQVTNGPWEVRTVHGVDQAHGIVYFSGTERSAIGRDVYRVGLDGSGLTRLSGRPGTHTATFNPSFTLYADAWSDVTTPPELRVHRANGTEVRLAGTRALPALAEYRLSNPELLQVPARDGFMLEAMLIKPPGFDPSRKYPVFQHTYAGPASPQVRNAWGGTSYLFLQLLAQQGIVVWICDNRSASGKGAASAWPVYRRLGELELQDIEDGLRFLEHQPWVDASRIGLSGWSYGGFMTSYALTHSSSFAMGIAGGSVTDWRDYDSVYTERFMRTPQRNRDGYASSAPRAAAARLSGDLLLLHGTMDDNVHLQNTLQFAYELQRAGKPFEMMLYPKSRHGVSEPLLVKHMRQLMLDFTLRTLRPDGTAQTSVEIGGGAGTRADAQDRRVRRTGTSGR
jgi:dipeptidyl-peptidase 4